MARPKLQRATAAAGTEVKDRPLRNPAPNATQSQADLVDEKQAAQARHSKMVPTLKAVLCFLYLYSGYVAIRDLCLSILGRSRAVVVYYHRVGSRDVLGKTVRQFRSDLSYLKKHYECITLAELSRRLANRVPFRRRAAVITFDDGYRDNYLAAMPLLQEAGLPATFFVATGYIGTARAFPHDHRCDPLTLAIRPHIFPKLEWDDLREMEQHGFEIGSHTVNHANLAQVRQEEAEFEIVSSLATLNRELGQKPRAFSFPWGKPADISDEALQMVRNAGYYTACSAYGGTNTRNGNPFQILRVDIGNGNVGTMQTRARIGGLDPDYIRTRFGRFGGGFKAARLGQGMRWLLARRRLESKRRSKAVVGITGIGLALSLMAVGSADLHAGLRPVPYPAPNELRSMAIRPHNSSHAVIHAAAGSLGRSGTEVLYVATTGRDDNPGTIGEPFLTPSKAVREAVPGTTILIKAGTYYLDRSLLIDKPGLTLRSSGEGIGHLKAPVDERSSVTSAIVISSIDVALIGLEVEGGSYYGVKVDAEPGHSTTGVSITGCRIHHTGRDCIKTFNADQLTIQDCDIGPSGIRDPSDAEGIDSIGSVGVIIRRCHIHDTATNGLYLKGGARDGVVEQCRVENIAGFAGIVLGEDTDAEFMRDSARYEAINCVARNNIVLNAGAAGLATYSGCGIRFENNTLVQVAGKLQAAFWIVTNSRKVPSTRISIVNNIAVMSSSRPFVFAQNLDGVLNSDWNIYFNTGGAQKFVRENTAAADQYDQLSLVGWRRMMQADSHSTIADPLLDLADTYSPMPGSAAIGHGVALPGVKTDYRGLERGASYDIGAVQHSSRTREASVSR